MSGTVIDESGAVQQWAAVYMWYLVERTVMCGSLDEAVRFLVVGLDGGDLYPSRIVGPGGDVVMESDEIVDIYYEGPVDCGATKEIGE